MGHKTDPFSALKSGDLRTVGKAAAVLGWIEREPALIDEIIAALPTPDEALNLRLMDVLEKHAARHPEFYRPHVGVFLGRIGQAPQKEIRWHVARLLRHVRLSTRQAAKARMLMKSYLADQSRIVQAEAAETYYRLTAPDDRPRAMGELATHAKTASPAFRARLRKIASRHA